MFCNEIGWHDLQIRQVSGKLADCAVQFANWPDWQIGRNIYTAVDSKNVGIAVHILTANRQD